MTYGYFWYLHNDDGSTFIACRDDDGLWYMAGIGHPISQEVLDEKATLLGPVPRIVEGGASIDN